MGETGRLRRARVAALAALLATSAAGCWSMPGQGPRRQGHNPFETAITVGNVDTLAPVWSTTLHRDGHPLDPNQTPLPEIAYDPVVSSAGLLNVSGGSSVHGLNPTTGELVWQWSYVFNTTSNDDEVFATADGRLAGASRTTGLPNPPFTSTWYRADGEGPFTSGPDVGTIQSLREPWVVGSTSQSDFAPVPGPGSTGVLRVANLDDPSQDWTGRLGRIGWHGLALTDDAIILVGWGVAGADGTTLQNGIRSFALDGPGPGCAPDLACPEWSSPIDDGVAASPIALSDDDATAYFSTDAGTVYAASTEDGTIHWSASVGAGYTLAPALADGVLLVPTASGSLVALDADGCGTPTCSPLWTTAATGGELTQQPSVAGGVVFTGDADGTLAAFELAGCGAATCGPLWTDELGSRITGAPAITLGKVFVGLQDGRVIAYAPGP